MFAVRAIIVHITFPSVHQPFMSLIMVQTLLRTGYSEEFVSSTTSDDHGSFQYG